MAMSRLRVATAAALTVGVLAGGAYYLSGHHHASSTARAADRSAQAADRAAVRVTTVPAKAHGLERTVTRPGSVRSFDYADLYAKVSGYLKDQVVDIDSEIHKGEVLARVYAPELKANVQKAEAELQRAKVVVEVKQARVLGAEADLREAKAHAEQVAAELQSSVATRELRGKELHRYEGLAQSGSVEPELVDEKRAAHEAAMATEKSARKAIITAQAKVAAADAAIKEAEADLNDARAQVAIAQATLANAQAFWEYTTIRAPFDGVVTRRYFHNGDFIHDPGRGGTTPLLTVNRMDKMRIVIFIPNRYVPYLRKGQPARLAVDALAGRVFKGKIARIARSAEQSSRTMRVEMDLPNPDNVLTDGMYGNVTIDLGREEGLAIPSACLTGEEVEGQRAVWVVRDGQAHRVPVRVESDDGVHAVVTSPHLKAGEPVVEGHSPGLEEGAAVAVAEAGERGRVSAP